MWARAFMRRQHRIPRLYDYCLDLRGRAYLDVGLRLSRREHQRLARLRFDAMSSRSMLDIDRVNPSRSDLFRVFNAARHQAAIGVIDKKRLLP